MNLDEELPPDWRNDAPEGPERTPAEWLELMRETVRDAMAAQH